MPHWPMPAHWNGAHPPVAGSQPRAFGMQAGVPPLIPASGHQSVVVIPSYVPPYFGHHTPAFQVAWPGVAGCAHPLGFLPAVPPVPTAAFCQPSVRFPTHGAVGFHTNGHGPPAAGTALAFRGPPTVQSQSLPAPRADHACARPVAGTAGHHGKTPARQDTTGANGAQGGSVKRARSDLSDRKTRAQARVAELEAAVGAAMLLSSEDAQMAALEAIRVQMQRQETDIRSLELDASAQAF